MENPSILPSREGLEAHPILVAEFQYISQTAFQANEDRARVSNYYFVTTGAAVAAIISAQFDYMQGHNIPGVYFGFTALFATLAVVGLLTILELARLRSAWIESARAMNKLKDYFSARYPDLNLDEAFAWKTSTVPPPDKKKSVAYLLALSVTIVAAVSAGAAAVYLGLFLGNSFNDPILLFASFICGIGYGVFQMFLYHRWLRVKVIPTASAPAYREERRADVSQEGLR